MVPGTAVTPRDPGASVRQGGCRAGVRLV